MTTAATTCFDASRFRRLLRAHWAEQRRNYALFWLVVAAVHVLLMLILLSANHGKGGETEAQAIVFWCGLIASGIIFASLYFAALRKHGAALVLLTRPASVLEKWLLAVLFVLIIWPLAYTVSATIIHACAGTLGYQWNVFHHIANNYATLPEKSEYALFIPMIRYLDDQTVIFAAGQTSLLSIYVGLSGFTLFGSIYFRKNAGITTAVVAFVIFLLTLLLGLVLDAITGHSFRPEFLNWWDNGNKANTFLPSRWISNLLFWLATPILMWVCALLALREKDLA